MSVILRHCSLPISSIRFPSTPRLASTNPLSVAQVSHGGKRTRASMALAGTSGSNDIVSSKGTSFNQLIESLIRGVDLSEFEAEESLDFLLSEADEVVGLARAMHRHAKNVEGLGNSVDVVGTGGDEANTVNISTGASILAAACGASVAKRGNRSSSSACGSVDVLEALGVAIDLDPEELDS